MFNTKKTIVAAMFAVATGALATSAASAAGTSCDWRDGMVDLDRCPAVRASLEALGGAFNEDPSLGCEDALGAALDALWTDPLDPTSHRALDAVVHECRADFLLRSGRATAHLHD